MSDRELVEILSGRSEDYVAEFQKAAGEELRQRGLELNTLVNTIRVHNNNEAEKKCDIREALTALKQPFQHGDVLSFVNYLDEAFVIQKTITFWVIQFFIDGDFQLSFVLESADKLEKTVAAFLRLEEWEADEDACFDDWDVLAKTTSQAEIESYATLLAKLKIPYLVNNANLWRFQAIRGTYYEESSSSLLIPTEYRYQADEVFRKMNELIDDLYQQLSESEEREDVRTQLQIYEKLQVLTPDDETVFFNKGSLLLEQGEFEAAADALIKCINLEFGKQYSEVLNDAADCLERIGEQLPRNIEILHCLASIAMRNEDSISAIERYSQIISINSADSIAHLNLGYLYSDASETSERAKKHFQAYVQLEPDADDRLAVENMILNL